MTGPIEIKPEDIIDKPEGFVPKSTGTGGKETGGFDLANIKKMIQDGKEIVDMAQSMGFDLRRFLPGIGGRSKENQTDVMQNTGTPSGAQQAMNFIQLLKAIYGDVTVNEALDNLKRDFGSLKLSELGRKQLK